ncbi:hypothetical protein H0H92_005789 [Tricholoma furcatifolium]|nr:hypothetical protein H0H92_005789 [Tricholoma furcatifolium]
MDTTPNEELIDLRRQYNNFNLISRLPDEILLSIFLYLRDESVFPTLDSPRFQFWPNVTHVCHRWRALALSSAVLWTRIPCAYPEYAEEMLKRSKGAPLTILGACEPFCVSKHIPDEDVLKALTIDRVLALESGRIKELFICGYWPEGDAFKFFERPAPELMVCDLRLDGVKFPDNFFGGESPLLRRFVAAGCGINWNSSAFANLTHLGIASAPEEYMLSAADFFSALSGMKHLKELSLYNAFLSRLGTTANNPVPEVCLPNLNILDTQSDVAGCTIILNYLEVPCIGFGSFPPKTFLCITCFPNNGWAYTVEEYAHFTRLGLVFEKRFSELHGTKTLDSLAILYDNKQEGRNFYRFTSLFSGVIPMATVTDMAISIPQRAQAPSITSLILDSLSLHNLQALLIGKVPLSEEQWKRFGNLESLRIVTIPHQINADIFLKVFCIGVPGIGGESDARPTFHGLNRLSIENWFFSHTLTNEWFPRETNRFEVLKRILKARYDAGMMVESLVITYCCPVSPSDLLTLRNFVKVYNHLDNLAHANLSYDPYASEEEDLEEGADV